MTQSEEQLRALIAKLRDESVEHNKANTPVNEGFASGLRHAADRFEAALGASSQASEGRRTLAEKAQDPMSDFEKEYPFGAEVQEPQAHLEKEIK